MRFFDENTNGLLNQAIIPNRQRGGLHLMPSRAIDAGDPGSSPGRGRCFHLQNQNWTTHLRHGTMVNDMQAWFKEEKYSQ